ncbi:DUF397 domain-containing protein [Streptomyces sp. ICBB 8177]|uniref:DUF397 domain-containing protein n=1 Tax=Streptomyces sp. ICBB 8177 TaxID=563922 RepID=UPI000D67DB6B|nr:DUF397 domain-containing protein [Streptomyces sp. ICBB 8177]PWI45572.1 DUF397 domain-containing protein [Streptomyces sp. ICBB 8177]
MNDALRWFKSTHSGDEGGACAEVAACPSVVHVRDSKEPQGPTPHNALSPTRKRQQLILEA